MSTNGPDNEKAILKAKLQQQARHAFNAGDKDEAAAFDAIALGDLRTEDEKLWEELADYLAQPLSEDKKPDIDVQKIGAPAAKEQLVAQETATPPSTPSRFPQTSTTFEPNVDKPAAASESKGFFESMKAAINSVYEVFLKPIVNDIKEFFGMDKKENKKDPESKGFFGTIFGAIKGAVEAVFGKDDGVKQQQESIQQPPDQPSIMAKVNARVQQTPSATIALTPSKRVDQFNENLGDKLKELHLLQEKNNANREQRKVELESLKGAQKQPENTFRPRGS